MMFENNGGKISYLKSELYSGDNSTKYLYSRDLSGKPGLFLTGNISANDIKKLMNDNRSEFINKKILWFPNGKLVNNDMKLSNLPDYRQMELKGIFEQLRTKGDKIAADVIKILSRKLPEKTLLTILIGSKFVGEISDYVEFFNKGVLNKKKGTIEEKLVCGVCNKEHLIHSYSENPLPFFFTKKLHYFDSSEISNVARGFPVCHDCHTKLGNGIKFIKNRLDYRVSNLQVTKKEQKTSESGIRFWLIPSLNNYRLLERFKNNLGNKSLYYLQSLKELCSSLHSIETFDVESKDDYTEAFLRFSALFYTMDKQALMRVLSVVHDIYPPQLRKLLDVKDKIDKTYPFRHVKTQDYFMGLPLLVTFYKGIKPQWETQIISILNKMFTGQHIPIEEIIDNINFRVHQALRMSYDMEILSRIVFDGLMLLEYIITLNDVESGNNKQDSKVLMLNISTYETKHVQRFIESHETLLNTQTKQGIFAAGVSVAILFHVQEEKFSKTAPYWDKVSRLDLNLQKVKDFVPDVKKRLAIYRNRDYDTIVSYLASAYTIDPDDSSVSKDLTSYIFSLGLSFGYLIARRYLKHEEVITE
jgi:CRISPR-associated protein Cas8b/Csh1 subtype I-B